MPRPHSRLFLLAPLFMAFAGALNGASAQLVRAYVAEDSITVGDHFRLIVVAEHAQADSVAFPEIQPRPEGTAFGDALVLDRVSSGRRFLGVGHRYPLADTIVYRATTFAIDTAVVGSIPVAFKSPERETARQSDPFDLLVSSVLTPDAESLRDITPIADFPRSPLPWIILAVGLVGAFILYRWLSRRKPKEIVVQRPTPRPPPPAPVESPLAEANRRLAALEKWKLEDQEEIKPYFVELSEIVRTYIERRLHISALESTTHELIVSMRKYVADSPVPDDVVTDIHGLLETADLAKFADIKHGIETCTAGLSEARVLVMRIEDSFRPQRPVEPQQPDDRAGIAAPTSTSAGAIAGASIHAREERPAESNRRTSADEVAEDPAPPTPEEVADDPVRAASNDAQVDTSPSDSNAAQDDTSPTDSNEAQDNTTQAASDETRVDSSPEAPTLEPSERAAADVNRDNEEGSTGTPRARDTPPQEVRPGTDDDAATQDLDEPLVRSEQRDVDEWERNAPWTSGNSR
ncbi:MAG: hypothetical protein R2832_08005 [Rhodothermales bacterium]